MNFVYEKPDNLVDHLETYVRKYAANRMYGVKNAAGGYDWVTYAAVGRRVDDLRAGLAGLGVTRGDMVGYIGRNSVEWVVAAFATYGLGAVFVPMYEAELTRVRRYIIKDSGLKVLFVSSPEIRRDVESFRRDTPALREIVMVDGGGDGTLAGLEAAGSARPVESFKPGPRDVASLIYTSGTTGEPKGVLLTHGNYTSNVQAGHVAVPELNEHEVSFAILPWAHTYGQTAELHNFMQFGGAIAIMDSLETLTEDLPKVRPSSLIAVPKVFVRIHDGLWARMNEQGGLARRLFVMGVEAGRERRRLAGEGRRDLLVELRFKLAQRIVFRKIIARFGGRLNKAMTGSSTMNREIAEFFEDIGIRIFDCYGLTECSPGITMNTPACYRFGTVGKPLQHIRVVIDRLWGDDEHADGEIVVYGPNVMRGYHNKPEETRAVMTADGGFRTGDRGRFDADGFLCITGRIKEQYKLENGKYVFPSALEEDIKLHPLVANAVVYGDGRSHNVCLIVLDLEALARQAREKGQPADHDTLFNDAAIRTRVETEVVEFLKGRYGSYEIPRKFGYLREDCSVAAGTLTQTMKIKRGVVYERYRAQIDALYDE